jgi:hypothetical protein
MCGHVNGNGFDLVVCFAVGGLVGNGKAVVMKFALTEHDIEFCADEVLKHSTNVIGAAARDLELAGLVEEVVNVGPK